MILGLDLATTTGVALLTLDGGLEETWTIKSRRVDPLGRVEDLAAKVAHLVRVTDPVDVWAEAIGTRFIASAIFMGRIHQATSHNVAAVRGVDIHDAIGFVSPAEVKRHATGKGNANKDEMIAAALERWAVDLTADEADAAWVADLGRLRWLEANRRTA